MKYVSVESSIALAEAMMQHHDNAQARTELERALLLSDKLGQKPLSARARYLLAEIAVASGNTNEARDDYREVVRLLDEMKKDPGAEKLLEREDLKSMYSAATQAVQSAKG
jgi:Tfp pilus assembly protein PilF